MRKQSCFGDLQQVSATQTQTLCAFEIYTVESGAAELRASVNADVGNDVA